MERGYRPCHKFNPVRLTGYTLCTGLNVCRRYLAQVLASAASAIVSNTPKYMTFRLKPMLACQRLISLRQVTPTTPLVLLRGFVIF